MIDDKKIPILSHEECVNRLKEIIELGDEMDTEQAHIDADCIVLGLLRHLGYDDVVSLWDSFSKWYA